MYIDITCENHVRQMSKKIKNNQKQHSQFPPYILNFFSFHTPPLQLCFCDSILFFFRPLYNPNRNRLFNKYLPTLFIITLFIIIIFLFFIICFNYLFVTIISPPFSLIILAWYKWRIIVTQIFLKEKPPLKRTLILFTIFDFALFVYVWNIFTWRTKRKIYIKKK